MTYQACFRTGCSPMPLLARIAAVVLGLALAAPGVGGQGVLYQWDGEVAGDEFGRSVSGAGDVNADGYADLIVGAPSADFTGTDSGFARAFSGFDGVLLYTWFGGLNGDNFGSSVSGAGDVNGDGFDDLVVGAPSADSHWASDTGRARVFSGLDGVVLHTWEGDSAYDYFGGRVSGAGDINNDGFDDLVVGAVFDDPNGTNSGSARAFSGVDGAILYTFNGDSAGDYFGWSVCGAGDVNNDGFDDLVVGAVFDDPNGTNSGSARVCSGVDGVVLYTFDGDSNGDEFGSSVSGAGDINNDGFDDLLVGAVYDDPNGTNSGSARVFSGVDGAILYTFNGDSAGDYFGGSVSGAGDINNDGFDDLVVGAYGDDNHGTNSGSARVFSGIDGAILYALAGDSSGDEFGHSVGGAGDVNADGYADLIVGAHKDDNNGNSSGSARVLTLATPFIDCNGNAVPDADDITSGTSHDNNANGVPDECEEVTSYGVSCGGLGASYVNSPTVGSQVFQLVVFGAAPNKAGLFMVGASSLDIDLTAFGAAGCSLYQDLEVLIPATTNGVGSISWVVPIPNDPLLLGVTVYQQWAVFDTSANPLGVTTSEALAIWIQP